MEHPPGQAAPLAAAPLPTVLSRALVAFIIEFDNEFEHRMPHRTTRHGATGGLACPPWLVSMAMWAHCMRHVPPGGIAAGELAWRSGLSAKSTQMMVKRMSGWWGYLSVGPGPDGAGAKPPRSAWLVRPTSAGRQAQDVWQPLTDVIEGRWRDRFGRQEIERLRAALLALAARFGTALPDFLPVGEPRLGQRAAGDGDVATTLPGLLSQVLLAFALDFERASDLSLGQYTASGCDRLAVGASVLRVIGDEGVRASDIPALTGVAKMTVDNWLGSLEAHRYLATGPAPGGGRHKVATLTGQGRQARDAYRHWAGRIEGRWQARFGTPVIRELRACAAPIRDEALLWQGAAPYPDGWRAEVRRPASLPHYPVLSHRGGFPDGS